MTTTTEQATLLRPAEAAKLAGIPSPELRKLLAAGIVPGVVLRRGRALVQRAALEAWLRGEDGHAGARRQG